MEQTMKKWSLQSILISYGVGMVVTMGVLLLGAFLLERGTLPETLLPALGGLSLFLGVTLGGALLAKGMGRPLVTTLCYNAGWGLLLLVIKFLCWSQTAMGNWWIWLILLASAVAGALLGSRRKKKKFDCVKKSRKRLLFLMLFSIV